MPNLKSGSGAARRDYGWRCPGFVQARGLMPFSLLTANVRWRGQMLTSRAEEPKKLDKELAPLRGLPVS